MLKPDNNNFELLQFYVLVQSLLTVFRVLNVAKTIYLNSFWNTEMAAKWPNDPFAYKPVSFIYLQHNSVEGWSAEFICGSRLFPEYTCNEDAPVA